VSKQVKELESEMNSLVRSKRTDPDEYLKDVCKKKLRSLEPTVLVLRRKQARILREEEEEEIESKAYMKMLAARGVIGN